MVLPVTWLQILYDIMCYLSRHYICYNSDMVLPLAPDTICYSDMVLPFQILYML